VHLAELLFGKFSQICLKTFDAGQKLSRVLSVFNAPMFPSLLGPLAVVEGIEEGIEVDDGREAARVALALIASRIFRSMLSPNHKSPWHWPPHITRQ